MVCDNAIKLNLNHYVFQKSKKVSIRFFLYCHVKTLLSISIWQSYLETEILVMEDHGSISSIPHPERLVGINLEDFAQLAKINKRWLGCC